MLDAVEREFDGGRGFCGKCEAGEREYNNLVGVRHGEEGWCGGEASGRKFYGVAGPGVEERYRSITVMKEVLAP